MTHITVDKTFLTPTDHIDINNDGIGYVESYDFSRANMSKESRIAAITTIASVCYQNPKSLGSISLYDRLATENKGLPSSSYEFVPVLIDVDDYNEILEIKKDNIPVEASIDKYGEWIEDGNYLLTNLRALIADIDDKADQYFNGKEECEIIAKHFKVFKSKIDLATARQFMRHRASWQELSRRYVSGKRAEFEFYHSDVFENLPFYVKIIYKLKFKLDNWLYQKAIALKIKPENARRVISQSMYTTVWSAWQPKQLKVFYRLRCDKHAQSEIQELAISMKFLAHKSDIEKDTYV